MPAGLSATVANGILDALCRSVAWSEPAEFWVKLHTNNPGSAGANNAAAETDRQQATFDVAYNGTIQSSTALVWTAVAATETYRWVSYWDAAAAGNFLGSAQLQGTNRAVTAGDDFTIAPGFIYLDLGPLRLS